MFVGEQAWESTDDGQTFTPMMSGPLVFGNSLPNFYTLAISSDGQHLFAATDAGPLYYNRDLQQWIDLKGSVAPDQQYMFVEYINSTQTARFATFGRGVWDFSVIDRIFIDGFE